MPRSSRAYRSGANIRLQERDKAILEKLYRFDGVLSFSQIDRLFFTGNKSSWTRQRLRALDAHGFIQTVSGRAALTVPPGETAYMLGEQGAAFLAGMRGEDIREFKWRDVTRPNSIGHDLRLNDVRLSIETTVAQNDRLELFEWIPESELFADPDTVAYVSRNGEERTRQLRPDGFFSLRYTHADGRVQEFVYLLELDMGTEDNPRFYREKLRPGSVYIGSEQYVERFGRKYGRWLIVTTGERRLNNMRKFAAQTGKPKLFYFTTFEQATGENILSSPIWKMADSPTPFELVAPLVRS